MQAVIWGCRGSIPVATPATTIQQKLKTALAQARGRQFADQAEIDRFVEQELPWPVANSFGGNSSCVQIDTGTDEYLICDLGSGLREFGTAMLQRHGPASPQTYNVLLSHLHWDHIMGFPFFHPAFIPGNKIRIHSCHPDPIEAFWRQQSAPCFPVDFDALSADIEFVPLVPGEAVEVAGATVHAILQYHEGDSFGYRIECDDRSVVYSTDSEHKQENADDLQKFADFFADADLVIFDAQYSLAEMVSLKEDWGHSSNLIGVELCHMAKAKHLLLYHHEPAYDDETLFKMLQETIRYEELARPEDVPALKVSSAYDGMALSF